MPSPVTLSFSDTATTATGNVSTQQFLTESAAARDSIASSGLSLKVADKATTHDAAESDAGNIANNRYVR
jgi:hypothetical protein